MAEEEPPRAGAARAEPGVRHSLSFKQQQLKILTDLASGAARPSMEAFKAHMTAVAGSNPYLAPMPLGGSKEADARRNFLARSATGKMQIADPGAVWIDITDE